MFFLLTYRKALSIKLISAPTDANTANIHISRNSLVHADTNKKLIILLK